MTREGALMRRIMLALSEAGARVWRNNVGFATYKNGVVVKYGIGNPGGSDLIGLYNGRFLAIEVKNPGENPTAGQVRFIEGIKAAGGVAGVARSVEDAITLLSSPPATISRVGTDHK